MAVTLPIIAQCAPQRAVKLARYEPSTSPAQGRREVHVLSPRTATIWRFPGGAADLLFRRFPYGHPDPFRSVRYLGLAAARCSHPSGELPARSTVWLPAWLPVAGHKSPLVLVLGRSSLDGSTRPRTATKSATYGQLPAHLLRRPPAAIRHVGARGIQPHRPASTIVVVRR